MRVLHVTQPTDDGVGRSVRELVRFGLEDGQDVAVICPPGRLAEWAQGDGAGWISLPLERAPTASDLHLTRELRGLLDCADLVHLHSSKAGALGRAALASTRQRPPCIFTPHGWSWHVGGRLATVYQLIERALAPFADVIVAVSREDMAVGRRVLGQRARLRVIHNGVDTAAFTPEGPAAERPSHPLIVCVGRLSEAKGQADAIEALARLPGDSVLRLVGDGEDAAALGSLACDRGVSHRVEFIGAVDDPAPHLRAADVVVVPSRWDAQSRVLLEALACGCAIVATAVPGSEAVDGAGEIVPSRDSAALAASIGRLLRSYGWRANLRAQARQRAVMSYDLRRTGEEWQRLWREAARWR